MVDYDGKTGLFLINHREYLRLYKDIIKTCLTDRYLSIDVSIFDFKQHAEKSTVIENEELLEFISEYPEYEKILK